MITWPVTANLPPISCKSPRWIEIHRYGDSSPSESSPVGQLGHIDFSHHQHCSLIHERAALYTMCWLVHCWCCYRGLLFVIWNGAVGAGKKATDESDIPLIRQSRHWTCNWCEKGSDYVIHCSGTVTLIKQLQFAIVGRTLHKDGILRNTYSGAWRFWKKENNGNFNRWQKTMN